MKKFGEMAFTGIGEYVCLFFGCVFAVFILLMIGIGVAYIWINFL